VSDGARPRLQAKTWGVAVAVLAAWFIALGGLGGPGAVAAASPSPDPCDVIPGNCATITLTVTGNGTGALYTGDGILNCHREGGLTTGTCFHRYDVSGGPIPWSIDTSPAPGSLACHGDICAPVGGAKGGLLHPGDAISDEAEFRLIATPAPTATPTHTPKPTPRPTRSPTPTSSPTEAAPTESAAGSPSPAPGTAAATPEPTTLPAASPPPSSPPAAPAATTETGPSIVILVLGALLIGAAGFGAGYATALRRR